MIQIIHIKDCKCNQCQAEFEKELSDFIDAQFEDSVLAEIDDVEVL